MQRVFYLTVLVLLPGLVGTAAAPAKRRATVHRIRAPTRAAHHAFSSSRRPWRIDGDRVSEARVVIRAEPIAAILVGITVDVVETPWIRL